jgi:hypothetical protein
MPRIETISVHEELRSELEALEGVQRAVVDGVTGEIVVVCDTRSQGTVEPGLDAILEREGISAESAEVFFTGSGPQRRVRFDTVEVKRPRPNYTISSVELGWEDRTYIGRSEGEGGGALELRVCAQATVEAIHAVVAGEVTFQLVGVKAIRIFDHDLIAVLLHSPQAADRRLVGLSLVVDDPDRSACVAVLNATNRMLGNYLGTTD